VTTGRRTISRHGDTVRRRPTADIDPGAIEQLITCCVEYDRIRRDAHHVGDTAETPDSAGGGPGAGTGDSTTGTGGPDAGTADGTAGQVLAMLKHQILPSVN
jgi:hypothetical protein